VGRVQVEDLFTAIEQKLRADFTHLSGSIKHSPSKGRWREAQVIEEFLRLFLPRNVAVAHGGEVVSVGQKTSAECDVVVFDPTVPPLLEAVSFRVLPVEIVFGVIEVKSHLDGAKLKTSIEKLQAIKRLEKKAFLSTPVTSRPPLRLYGEEWDFFPVATFIFAFDSISLRRLGRLLAQLQADVEPRHRLDGIWVLDKGYITNTEDDPNKPGDWRVALTPRADTGLAVVQEAALMQMAVHMQTLFQFAWQPGFKLLDYLSDSNFGYVQSTLARVSVQGADR